MTCTLRCDCHNSSWSVQADEWKGSRFSPCDGGDTRRFFASRTGFRFSLGVGNVRAVFRLPWLLCCQSVAAVHHIDISPKREVALASIVGNGQRAQARWSADKVVASGIAIFGLVSIGAGRAQGLTSL